MRPAFCDSWFLKIRCIANEIRWRPAYKQLLYRDDAGQFIVTISQNAVGNAITELLGIVVKREEDDEAYASIERALVGQLLEFRNRLVWANLGEPLSTPSWPHGSFVVSNVIKKNLITVLRIPHLSHCNG